MNICDGFRMRFLILFILLGTTARAEQQEVPIGVIAPLTLGNAERGEEIRRTLTVLTEQLNSKSSKYRFHLIFEDGVCGVGSSASTSAEKLLRVQKVRFLITGCSGETLQVAPIAQRSGALTMAVFSSHPEVKHLGDLVFRSCPDQERAVETFREELRCSSENRIGLLTEENAFTQGLKKLLMTKIPGVFLKEVDFPPETTDFRTMLLKFRGADLQALYLNAASPRTLGLLVKQARDLGLTMPFYAFFHPDDPAFFSISGPAAEGLRYIGVPDMKASSAEFKSFLDAYQSKFSQVGIEPLMRMTFDGFFALAQAIEAVGPEPAQVKGFLAQFRAPGSTGPIAFDKNGDIENLNFVLRLVHADGSTQVESNCGGGKQVR